MANLTYMLIIVMSINVMLFLGQAAVLAIDPNAASNFYNCNGNMLEQFDSNSCDNSNAYVLDTENSIGGLPGGVASVSPTTGNVFTDIFTTAYEWIVNSIPGASYLLQLLGAPYFLLQALGLPNIFVFSIGTMWYGVTFFLIVAFLLGRQLE